MAPRRLAAASLGAVYVAVERDVRSSAQPAADADEQLWVCVSAARQIAATTRRFLLINVAPDTASHASWLAWAILEQLGKDPDLQRGELAAEHSLALTEIWLRAHKIDTLFVIGAERLGVPLWRRMASMATAAHMTIALLNPTRGLSRGHRRLLNGDERVIPTWDVARFMRWASDDVPSWADRTAVAPVSHTRTPGAPFPAVPPDELPFFRTTCRQLLSSQDFAVVDRSYRRAFESANRWLDRAEERLCEEQVGEFLAELIRDARGMHDQLARLRGAQAAFWRGRWLLKVRPDALVAAYRVEPHGIDRAQAMQLLNGYVSPRTAALGALALRTRLSPARLAQLNADQLARDCRAINIDEGRPLVLAPERPLIAALRLDAQRNGRDPSGPLFCDRDGRRLRPQALKQLLRRTAIETGLPLTQTWSVPVDRQHSFWMHRRGLTLQPLAPRVI